MPQPRAPRAPFVATLALLLVPAMLAAQPDLADATLESTPVAGNVHMLSTQMAGNVGVSAGPDGILIVDDQFAPLADKIRAALGEIAAGELAFVVNTHWHPDHTDGNRVFGAEAPIVAHQNVRQRLSTRQELFGQVHEPAPAEALPVITFGDSLSIHFNGEEIRAIHLPHGHTDGDIAVWFMGSNVIHMGDQFFNGMLPFIDLASGGDVEGYARNVAAVLERLPADTRVIPGHGPLGTVEDLRRSHTMLEETIAAVRDGIAAGRTLEEIQAAGLPEPWGDWAWPFITAETWIAVVHASLTGNPGASAPNTHGH